MKKNIINACGAAIIAAALATPAIAQVEGTYVGTSADGNGLTFIVGTDPNTGDLAVTSASIFFTAPCKNSTYVLNTGWGFGLNSDIKFRRVAISSNDNYFAFAITLDFASDGQSATGTITSTSPTLTPVGPRPTHALICTSPKQELALTLQPAADAAQKGLAFVPGKNQINLRSPRAGDDTPAEASH
jgi:hypothetical protein